MELDKQIDEIKRRTEGFTAIYRGLENSRLISESLSAFNNIYEPPALKELSASMQAIEKSIGAAMRNAANTTLVNGWWMYNNSDNPYGPPESFYGGTKKNGYLKTILSPLISPDDFLWDIKNNSHEVEQEEQPDIKVHPINEKLYGFLSKNPRLIHEVHPRRFEEIIADILEKMGYKVELTPETRDGGRDIILFKKMPALEFSGIVECKRYSPNRTVPVSMIRDFIYTVISAEKKNFGLFVTSSFFTKGAYNLPEVKSKLVQLKDFDNISKWFAEYKK